MNLTFISNSISLKKSYTNPMRKKEIDLLPYRKNVACVVFQGDNFLLVQLSVWHADWWKFPQGGVEDGESDEKAAKRELMEELGNEKFKIVAKSIHTNKYDWPDETIEAVNFRWRGQDQIFFLVEFYGNSEDIVVDREEIRDYRWVALEELIKSIDHKDKIFTNYGHTIKKILGEFNILKTDYE